MFPRAWADTVQRFRVPAGILLAAVFAWVAHPSAWSLLASTPLWILGLGLRAWAAGHLRKNTRLTVSGPYAFVRNPLYVGTLLVAAGFAVAAWSWGFAVLVLVVFLLVYQPVMENEERHLRTLFPDFDDYARKVPKLLPLGRQMADTEPFDWAVYRQNQEFKAMYGFLGVLAFLLVKLAWPT